MLKEKNSHTTPDVKEFVSETLPVIKYLCFLIGDRKGMDLNLWGVGEVSIWEK